MLTITNDVLLVCSGYSLNNQTDVRLCHYVNLAHFGRPRLWERYSYIKQLEGTSATTKASSLTMSAGNPGLKDHTSDLISKVYSLSYLRLSPPQEYRKKSHTNQNVLRVQKEEQRFFMISLP